MTTADAEELSTRNLLLQIYKMLSETPVAPAHRAALQTPEAAKYIGVSPATLKKWRAEGLGPNYAKHGSLVLYRLEDLDRWLRKHLVSKR